MGMKEIVTAACLTEPIRSLASTLSRSRGGRRFLTALSPRYGVFESFECAWKAAGAIRRHLGHEHPEAVARHALLADGLMPSDYAVLYWLNRITGDIRLFDYGGNMGNVYYGCSRYIETATRAMQWTVYDLPQIIEMAKRMAVKRSVPAPQFTTSIPDAAAANVLLVSGALHYWEKECPVFSRTIS